jgi:hypothetical protein
MAVVVGVGIQHAIGGGAPSLRHAGLRRGAGSVRQETSALVRGRIAGRAALQARAEHTVGAVGVGTHCVLASPGPPSTIPASGRSRIPPCTSRPGTRAPLAAMSLTTAHSPSDAGGSTSDSRSPPLHDEASRCVVASRLPAGPERRWPHRVLGLPPELRVNHRIGGAARRAGSAADEPRPRCAPVRRLHPPAQRPRKLEAPSTSEADKAEREASRAHAVDAGAPPRSDRRRQTLSAGQGSPAAQDVSSLQSWRSTEVTRRGRWLPVVRSWKGSQSAGPTGSSPRAARGKKAHPDLGLTAARVRRP